MAPFASADELAERLGVTFDEAEESRATSLLTTASGLIQAEARQRIEKVDGDELTLRGRNEPRLLLPERPVISVASVSQGGTELSSSVWYLDSDELVRKGGWYTNFLAGYEWDGSGWGSPDIEIVVTYTHGYETIPEAIKGVCLEAAVRAYVNPGSVSQEAYGSERTSYPVQGLMLTGEEKRTIHRELGRRSESLALR